jgi:hypothetical protein
MAGLACVITRRDALHGFSSSKASTVTATVNWPRWFMKPFIFRSLLSPRLAGVGFVLDVTIAIVGRPPTKD